MKIACCMVRLNHYQIGPDRLDGPNTDRVLASLQGAGREWPLVTPQSLSVHERGHLER